MIKLLIADDHRLFNDGLKHIVENHYQVVSQVYLGYEVLSEIHKHTPHVVLLDINMPGQNGLDIGRAMKSDFPKVKLIFISMYNESNFIKAAKDLGADAYLLKDSGAREILDAVAKVLQGEKVFDPRLEDNCPNLHHEDYFVKNFSLSKREVEVIRHIRNGLKTEEIARKMFLSYETVKSHRKNIFFKLKITSVAELIAFAIEQQV